MSLSQLRNIGIIAHVDAGKTTATERILYYTGKNHRAGDVHHGNTTTDYSQEERKRGITIYSATTTVFWRQHQLNIIDTPGHIDFNIEVNRSLRVLDGAVVLFDAVAGVEPQTETNWRLADQYEVPRVCFINKMDRVGANFFRTVNMIKERLNTPVAVLQLPIGCEDGFQGIVDILEEVAWFWPEENSAMASYRVEKIPENMSEEVQHYRKRLLETLSDLYDPILEAYLSESSVDSKQLKQAVRQATLENNLVPVLCGSAFKNKGVEGLLNAMVDYLPSPAERKPVQGFNPDESVELERNHHVDEPFCALLFKVVNDRHGSLSFIRIYSGKLEPGMTILNTHSQQKERIGRLYEMHAEKRKPKTDAQAGEIVAITGLKSATTGDTLCDPDAPILLESITVHEPVINMALEAPNESTLPALITALHGLVKEDPSLCLHHNSETDQLILSGMGELQLEVTINKLRNELNIPVLVGRPKVSYRETITTATTVRYRYKRQDGGPGQFAELELRMEPLERGAGFLFESAVSGGVIPKEFIPSVETGIRHATSLGAVEGYPMVDIKVTLLDGKYHEQDSSPVAFEKAATLAFQQGIKEACPVMLEPMMLMSINIPVDNIGHCIGDLSKRRGLILDQTMNACDIDISAHVPLANLFGYIGDLRTLTSGRGNFTMQLSHYREVVNG
jgi:elongation factor G